MGSMERRFGVRMPERAEVAADLKMRVREMLAEFSGDDIMHAEILAAGPFRWRKAFTKDLGILFNGNRIQCDHLANVCYHFFELAWPKKFPDVTPKAFLNNVRPISEPTEAEIEDAWELEIGSSDDAMRQNYEGSARTRKGRDLGGRKVKLELVH